MTTDVPTGTVFGRKSEALFATEQLIEASHELVQVPSVKDRLGAYAVQLTTSLERSRAIEIDSEGFPAIPNNQREIVPVSARRTGEQAIIHAHDSGMNQAQINAIESRNGQGHGYAAARETERHFIGPPLLHTAMPTFREGQLGVAPSASWQPDNDTVVFGRPSISMNLDGAVNGNLSPIVLLHEMTHVLQRDRAPIRTTESVTGRTGKLNMLEDELEAYHVAYKAMQGLRDINRQIEVFIHTHSDQMDKAISIERTRERHQISEKRPFFPTHALVRALHDKGLMKSQTAEVLAQ